MSEQRLPTRRTVHTLDRRGWVRDWLVSPAWSRPCRDLDGVLDAQGDPWGPDGRWVLTNGPDVAPLKARLYQRHPMVLDQVLPAVTEGGEVSWRSPGADQPDRATWKRVHTGWDGLVDWSQFWHTPHYQHAVAAVYLEVDQPEHRVLEVVSTGPLALWLDDDLAFSTGEFGYMQPLRRQVPVRLPSGVTRLFLATWQVAFRECRHVAGLRVDGLPLRVVIPSPGADEYAAAAAERALETTGAWPWAVTDGTVRLSGPGGAVLRVRAGHVPERRVTLAHDGTAEIDLSFDGAERAGHTDPADPAGTASMLDTGEVDLEVRIDEPAAPVSRTYRVAVLPRAHRPEPVGDDPAIWRAELLRHAQSGPPTVARALARLALEQDGKITAEDLEPALGLVESRGDCADFEAVGMLQLWHRVPESRWEPALRDRVRRALTGFKYWIDQPGLDAMCYFTENHQMVWHTAELLAGEAFRHDRFLNTGWTGAEHARHGREMATAWMRRKLAGGFSEFDSNAYLAIDSLALVSLVDFSEDPHVSRLAEALLDKVLLTLAANSWRGVHGAAHGRTYTSTLRSSRFEETAPIMWALWGTGALNKALLPAVALSESRRYVVPGLVRAVATRTGPAWEGRQVYRGQYALERDLLDRPYGSDLVVWRTPDAMLSSVQDYRAGLPGLQEHVWGATLGPETQVFATHPAAASHDPSTRPNGWAGQRILPRARQHRDTVLVVHSIPPSDPFGTTHLWFPVPHLDEHAQRGSWLAGRRGDGYVAVATDHGFAPTRSGADAWQAWMPAGPGDAYVATVGSRDAHGSFEEFVATLAEPRFSRAATGDAEVRWQAPDGRRLELSWSGSFLVDGADPDLERQDVPHHLDNPACRVPFGAATLLAEWEGQRLVLDLERGSRVEPASGIAGVATGGDR